LLPRNPLAILGTIVHQLLKESGQSAVKGGFDPQRRWEQLVAETNQKLKESSLETVLFPLETSARMYEVLRIRACTRAGQISSAAKERGLSAAGVPGTGFELWVESKDKSVGGWIDSARRTRDGMALSDFKSGEVLEQIDGIPRKKLKESHCIQLKLYASLYFQSYGIWPTTIQIVPLAGPKLEVPFTHEECSQLLEEAALTLKSLNSRISGGAASAYEAFASPSSVNCRFCSYRPACPKYREARERDGQTNGWPADAFGKVWDINILQDSRVNLRVAGGRGEQFTLRALSSISKRHPALQAIQRGDQVGIFNARASSNHAEFSEGALTVLYKFEGAALQYHVS
jgi:hypothetical protein